MFNNDTFFPFCLVERMKMSTFAVYYYSSTQIWLIINT